MNKPAGYFVLASLLMLSGCSAGDRQTRIFQTGEKATVDRLTYAVVDSQIYPRLGEDPHNSRVPQNRFYAIQIAVSSGASADIPIPAMTLVDDSGKVYAELADGAGLQHWLGVVRRISPAQTERGEILFDAPAAHYKLKLTSETDPDDVFIDLPLSFLHEQMTNEPSGPDTASPPAADTPIPPGKKK